MSVPDVPLTPEAQAFMEQLAPQITNVLAEVQRVPVSVLLWGPRTDGSGPMASIRACLRAKLRSIGHLAVTSEELVDAQSRVSLRVQEFVHARSVDLVVCIPATPGALAEAHDFAAHPLVRCKMIVFLDRGHVGGYSEQSLTALSTVLTSQLEYYDGASAARVIEETTLAQVQRLREMKFMYGWKESLV